MRWNPESDFYGTWSCRCSAELDDVGTIFYGEYLPVNVQCAIRESNDGENPRQRYGMIFEYESMDDFRYARANGVFKSRFFITKII